MANVEAVQVQQPHVLLHLRQVLRLGCSHAFEIGARIGRLKLQQRLDAVLDEHAVWRPRQPCLVAEEGPLVRAFQQHLLARAQRSRDLLDHPCLDSVAALRHAPLVALPGLGLCKLQFAQAAQVLRSRQHGITIQPTFLVVVEGPVRFLRSDSAADSLD